MANQTIPNAAGPPIIAVGTRIYRQGPYRYNAGVMSWRTADGVEIDTDVPLLALLMQVCRDPGAVRTSSQLCFAFAELSVMPQEIAA
jgi:hypothetical protein